MENNLLKIVVDTNVLISSIIFGGKPRQIIKLIQENKIIAVISPILIAELLEIFIKKFQFTLKKVELIQELMKENFNIVYPSKTLQAISVEDDNRVLEAAIEGDCSHIVSGDKDLLDLHVFEEISIQNPADFLKGIQH